MSEEINENGTQEEVYTEEETSLEGTEVGEKNGDSDDSGTNNADDNASTTDESTNTTNGRNYDPSEEISELRQFLREQKRELATLKAQNQRLEQQSQKQEVNDDDYEDDNKEETPIELSIIESLQEEIHTIGQERAGSLDLMVDAMAETQKYNDVKQVCTRQNFDDIFEMIAGEIVNKEGGNFDEVVLGVEAEVWRMPNPYKYMHGLIKQYHPKYETVGTTGKRNKTPADAPPSVVGMGGSASGGSGWTAAKIDNMPEALLHTVPKEVYNNYMMGKLK